MRKTRFKRFFTVFMIFTLSLLMLLKPTDSFAAENQGLFAGKYGKAQIFDVQRSPAYPSANQLFSLSGFRGIYDATSSWQLVDWGANNDRYVQFVNDATQNSERYPSAYTVKLNLYEVDGTLVKTISNYGTVWGLGDEGFFYEGHDFFGYFISNKQGFAYGSSVSYTPTSGLITSIEELNVYEANTSVLKEGQSQTVPGIPTDVNVVKGNGQVTVHFVAPTNDGGTPITEYTVTSYPDLVTSTGTSSPIVVPGLKNGTAYTFTVTATNSEGTSEASAHSESVTPSDPTEAANEATNQVEISKKRYTDAGGKETAEAYKAMETALEELKLMLIANPQDVVAIEEAIEKLNVAINALNKISEAKELENAIKAAEEAMDRAESEKERYINAGGEETAEADKAMETALEELKLLLMANPQDAVAIEDAIEKLNVAINALNKISEAKELENAAKAAEEAMDRAELEKERYINAGGEKTTSEYEATELALVQLKLVLAANPQKVTDIEGAVEKLKIATDALHKASSELLKQADNKLVEPPKQTNTKSVELPMQKNSELKTLPDTATGTYNAMVAGGFLIVLGLSLLTIRRFRKIS